MQKGRQGRAFQKFLLARAWVIEGCLKPVVARSFLVRTGEPHGNSLQGHRIQSSGGCGRRLGQGVVVQKLVRSAQPMTPERCQAWDGTPCDTLLRKAGSGPRELSEAQAI